MFSILLKPTGSPASWCKFYENAETGEIYIAETLEELQPVVEELLKSYTFAEIFVVQNYVITAEYQITPAVAAEGEVE